MQHLISKSDLAEYEEFSQNIEDRIIEPRINDAHLYDMRGVLPFGVIESVYAATAAPTAWDEATTYTSGALVLHKGSAYDWVADSLNIEPGTNAAYWKLNTGATLRYSLLKPFLAWNTLRRYFMRAGRNITPAGITVPTDPQGTFQPISDKGRGELYEEAKSKAEFHRTDIIAFLRDNNLYNSGTCGARYGHTRSRAWGI